MHLQREDRARLAAAAGQWLGPGPAAPTPNLGSPLGFRILPMQLRVGDRLVDETAEWEVVGTPYTTNAGKTAHVCIRRIDQPDVTQIRSLGRSRENCREAAVMWWSPAMATDRVDVGQYSWIKGVQG